VLRGQEDPGTETVIADAVEVVAVLRKLGSGVRRPLVADIRGSRSVTREARAYLAGDAMAEVASKIALVVGSSLSRAIGSFWLTFSRPRMPVKVFTSPEEALVWARTPD
jgi:hypothetical protein